VVRKESGSSIILGCKYHGWSYNAQGSLTKAPQFDNVEGFDKTQNGLFSIATRVVKGMVFVNFDPTKASDSPPFESSPMNQSICRALTELKCTHHWEFEGHFNWKVGRKSSSRFSHPILYWFGSCCVSSHVTIRVMTGYVRHAVFSWSGNPSDTASVFHEVVEDYIAF
jgi:hypothetical protein